MSDIAVDIDSAAFGTTARATDAGTARAAAADTPEITQDCGLTRVAAFTARSAGAPITDPTRTAEAAGITISMPSPTPTSSKPAECG